MRFAKKLLAMISSVAIIATIASALVVQAAEDMPIITPRLDDNGDGSYNLVVNMDTTNCAKGNKLISLNFGIELDGTKFDMANGPMHTYFDEDSEEDVYDNVVYGKPKFGKAGSFVYNNNTTFKYTYLDTTGKGQAMSSATDVITLKNLKLLDGVETDDIEITFSGFIMAIGASSTDCTTYGYQDAEVIIPAVASVTFPGNKTDDGDDTATNVTLNTYTDGDTDAAVSFMETLTAAVGNKITWTLSAKDADGADVSGSYTYEVPNMEISGDLTVGVIVQYNPTEYNSLAITKGTIQ